jgi:hypothetical protein
MIQCRRGMAHERLPIGRIDVHPHGGVHVTTVTQPVE